jgi:hypothetical protein
VPKIDAKFDLGLWWWPFLGLLSWVGFFFGWMELSQFDSFCTAGISYPSGFVFLAPFLGVFVLGGVGV